MAESKEHNVSYAACVAYYRNTLPVMQAARVRAYLATHAAVARCAEQDAACDAGIAQAWDSVLHEPLPQRLWLSSRRTRTSWPRQVAVAATIVLAAFAGWSFGNMTTSQAAAPNFAARVATAARQSVFVDTTAVAAHTASSVQAPDLSARGYHLVHREVVDGAGGGLLEFVYHNQQGQRLRIFAETDGANHIQPRVVSEQGVSLALWREGNTRYAMVGELPATSLQTLAQAARTEPARDDTLLVGRGHWQALRPVGVDAGAGHHTVSTGSPAAVVPTTAGEGEFVVQPSRM